MADQPLADVDFAAIPKYRPHGYVRFTISMCSAVASNSVHSSVVELSLGAEGSQLCPGHGRSSANQRGTLPASSFCAWTSTADCRASRV